MDTIVLMGILMLSVSKYSNVNEFLEIKKNVVGQQHLQKIKYNYVAPSFQVHSTF